MATLYEQLKKQGLVSGKIGNSRKYNEAIGKDNIIKIEKVDTKKDVNKKLDDF